MLLLYRICIVPAVVAVVAIIAAVTVVVAAAVNSLVAEDGPYICWATLEYHRLS